MNLMSLEFLERCEAVTKIYNKKHGDLFNIQSQMLKMFEEVAEVQRAILKSDITEVQEELVDVILSAITMFHKLGISNEFINSEIDRKLRVVEKRATKLSLGDAKP